MAVTIHGPVVGISRRMVVLTVEAGAVAAVNLVVAVDAAAVAPGSTRPVEEAVMVVVAVEIDETVGEITAHPIADGTMTDAIMIGHRDEKHHHDDHHHADRHHADRHRGDHHHAHHQAPKRLVVVVDGENRQSDPPIKPHPAGVHHHHHQQQQQQYQPHKKWHHQQQHQVRVNGSSHQHQQQQPKRNNPNRQNNIKMKKLVRIMNLWRN